MENAGLSGRIRLRHLRCFVAVAQERQVGRAAARLRLTQPAVTKTLNELELLAGTKLLERGRHGARPTTAGLRFLDHAERVVRAFDTAVADLAGTPGTGRDTVRIGSLPSAASVLLPDVLTALHDLHPDVGVQVHTAPNTDLLAALRGGDVDVVIGRMSDPDTMRGLSFELLYAEALAFVVRTGHPLAGRCPTVAQICEYPLVVSGTGTVPRHHTDVLLRRHGIDLPAGTVDTIDVAVAATHVRGSDAVWVVPERVPARDITEKRLSRLPVDTVGTAEPIGVVRPAAAASSIVDDIAALLRRVAHGPADM
ncbi:LysR substrate-binding domain-containing protein [Rhodococcus yananensis]|uniref:LysR substrate-binding domain-containing protein n=1 Tax=Rhodococcus yananensis TaxID=2879464 RepID=UPI001CF8D2CB|nr:LysR substrate-binding domain-containing protein [Rhodococcus yananensis]